MLDEIYAIDHVLSYSFSSFAINKADVSGYWDLNSQHSVTSFFNGIPYADFPGKKGYKNRKCLRYNCSVKFRWVPNQGYKRLQGCVWNNDAYNYYMLDFVLSNHSVWKRA